MKVLVPVKRVVDFNVKVRVKSDGSGVEMANVKMSMNPFDEIAVEEAVRLKEKGMATEVVAVSCGVAGVPGDAAHRAGAWAPTARSSSRPTSSCSRSRSPSCCKAVVDKEQPQLVILGKQAIDDDANQTGQMLAALLDWPQATFASKVEIADGMRDGHARGRRRPRDARGEAAGDRHHRPAPERAALRDAAQHHEGEEEAARDDRRPRRSASTSRRA